MQRRAASPLIIPPTRVPLAGNFWWSYLITEEETSFYCLISLNVTASRGLHIGRRELMTPWLTFHTPSWLTTWYHGPGSGVPEQGFHFLFFGACFPVLSSLRHS